MGATDGKAQTCTYVVAEGAGPRRNDVWCRVTTINPTAFTCRDDPTKYCHVITLRAGPNKGTYLKVDNGSPNRNNAQGGMRDRQARWFGGGSMPEFDFEHIKELVIYDAELADECTEVVHATHYSPRSDVFNSRTICNTSRGRVWVMFVGRAQRVIQPSHRHIAAALATTP